METLGRRNDGGRKEEKEIRIYFLLCTLLRLSFLSLTAASRAMCLGVRPDVVVAGSERAGRIRILAACLLGGGVGWSMGADENVWVVLDKEKGWLAPMQHRLPPVGPIQHARESESECSQASGLAIGTPCMHLLMVLSRARYT